MVKSQFATGECSPNGVVNARLCTGGCNSDTCGAVTSECSGSFDAFFAATCQSGTEAALPITSNPGSSSGGGPITSNPGSSQGSGGGGSLTNPTLSLNPLIPSLVLPGTASTENSSVSANNAGSSSGSNITIIAVAVASIVAVLAGVFGVFLYRHRRRRPVKMASSTVTTTTAAFYSSPPPSTSNMNVGATYSPPTYSPAAYPTATAAYPTATAAYPTAPAAYPPTPDYTTAYQQSYAPAAYPPTPAAYSSNPQYPPPQFEYPEVSISNYRSAPTTESSMPTTTETRNVDLSAVKFGAVSDVSKDDGVVQMLKQERNNRASTLSYQEYEDHLHGDEDDAAAVEGLLKTTVVPSFELTDGALLLNRYKIRGSRSTSGSTHSVLKAEDVVAKRLVAIKVFNAQTSSGYGTLKRTGGAQDDGKTSFLREVKMMRRVQSKFVAELREFHALSVENAEQAPNKYITVMEYLPQNLRDFIDRRRDAPDLILRNFARGITEALHYLHTNNIVHGDLKPSNCMIHDNVFIKLIDFEGARVAGKEYVVVSSLGYCAPEVAKGIRGALEGEGDVKVLASSAMDMFALGCIVFEMYAKRPLLDGRTDAEMLDILTSDEEFDQNNEVGEGTVPNAQARHLVLNLLSKDPRRRKTADSVLKSAFLNAGLDTHQLSASVKGVQQTLQSVVSNTEQLLTQTTALRRQLFLQAENTVPRLPLILPRSKTTTWQKVKYWGHNTFTLHLMCEHPDGPHFTDHKGYVLADPVRFVQVASPTLKLTLKLLLGTRAGMAYLTGFACVAGGPDPTIVDMLFGEYGRRQTEHLETLTALLDTAQRERVAQLKALKDRKTRGERLTSEDESSLEGVGADDIDRANTEVERSGEVDLGGKVGKVLCGRAIREMEVFLSKNDAGRTYGNLKRVVDGEGGVLWVCESHAEEYVI
ncbi:hypothetical protein HK102_014217 [Quaeritorhiza haematococci]|nr:hypothetical protein HK102_014217 [Quaeritorhiza haematococci]